MTAPRICMNCTHWRLQGDMAKHGYGQCQARPEQLRTAHTTTEQNHCRTGKFVAVVVQPASLF